MHESLCLSVRRELALMMPATEGTMTYKVLEEQEAVGVGWNPARHERLIVKIELEHIAREHEGLQLLQTAVYLFAMRRKIRPIEWRDCALDHHRGCRPIFGGYSREKFCLDKLQANTTEDDKSKGYNLVDSQQVHSACPSWIEPSLNLLLSHERRACWRLTKKHHHVLRV